MSTSKRDIFHLNTCFAGRETPKGWPARGRIQFRNCFMKYTPEDLPVLKNLNVVIESGWKVNKLVAFPFLDI